MKMKWLAVLCVLSGVMAAPTTQPFTTPDLMAIFTDAFHKIDADGNGHVEVSEFYKIFDLYDTDHDGKMSLNEYIKNTQADKTFAKEVFKFIDNNDDGVIPRGAVTRIFKLYDSNDDGQISVREFVSEYMKIFQEVVKNLGGVLTTPSQ